MADWINCFCLHEACVPSREWQRLTASVCSIMRSTDSVYWTVWWEEDLFSYRKKNKSISGSHDHCVSDSGLLKSLIKITHRCPLRPLVGQIASMPLLIFPSLFSPSRGSRVEIVWVDDEWFVSPKCLFAWRRNILWVFWYPRNSLKCTE